MKKKMRLLSIILAIVGIGMILLALTLNLSSTVWMVGAVILIVGALIAAFIGGNGNGENNIGSYRIPKI